MSHRYPGTKVRDLNFYLRLCHWWFRGR